MKRLVANSFKFYSLVKEKNVRAITFEAEQTPTDDGLS
jgi:hypothetical protein